MKNDYTLRDFISLLTRMADGGWEGRIEYSASSTYGVSEDVQEWRGRFTRQVRKEAAASAKTE